MSVQLLDGAANAIFSVVSVLVIAGMMLGTGRLNTGQGALATAAGLAAALGTTFGGKLIQHGGYRFSFRALGPPRRSFMLLWFAMPETIAYGRH